MKEIDYEEHACVVSEGEGGTGRRRLEQSRKEEYCFTKRFLAYFRPEVAAVVIAVAERTDCSEREKARCDERARARVHWTSNKTNTCAEREREREGGRVRTYRDTGSVQPGSEPIFDSVSGSENQIFGISCDRDTFCLC